MAMRWWWKTTAARSSGCRRLRKAASPMGEQPIFAVLADVDGTLVTKDKVLTGRAIAAVKRLQDHGVVFTICSGRSPRGLRMLVEPLGLTMPMAAFNGGVIVMPDLSVLDERAIPDYLVPAIVEAILAGGLEVWIYSATDWYVLSRQGTRVDRESTTNQMAPTVVATFDDVLRGVVKIVGVSEDYGKVAACEATLQQVFGTQVSAARSQPYYLDVTHPSANKGTVVERLARYMNIPETAIATLGDQPSDVAMFARSGLSVAMGNAHQDVQRLATHVTASYEDEGFAQAIDTYIVPRLKPAGTDVLKATAQLQRLGQSLWLDNITRDLLASGTLQRYIDDLSVTGLTSNPTIFEQAIKNSPSYDAEMTARLAQHRSGEALFFDLAIQDLTRAAALFRPIHDRTNGIDGWVSLEVSPLLAYDTAGTIAAAKQLFAAAACPNLMIKIPGTAAGLPAIEETIFAGIPINVTLLFSGQHRHKGSEGVGRPLCHGPGRALHRQHDPRGDAEGARRPRPAVRAHPRRRRRRRTRAGGIHRGGNRSAGARAQAPDRRRRVVREVVALADDGDRFAERDTCPRVAPCTGRDPHDDRAETREARRRAGVEDARRARPRRPAAASPRAVRERPGARRPADPRGRRRLSRLFEEPADEGHGAAARPPRGGLRPAPAHRRHVRRREDQRDREPRRAARRAAGAARRLVHRGRRERRPEGPCRARSDDGVRRSRARRRLDGPHRQTDPQRRQYRHRRFRPRAGHGLRGAQVLQRPPPGVPLRVQRRRHRLRRSGARSRSRRDALHHLVQDLHHARDDDQRAHGPRVAPRRRRGRRGRGGQALRRGLDQRRRSDEVRHRHRQHVRFLGLGRRPLLDGVGDRAVDDARDRSGSLPRHARRIPPDGRALPHRPLRPQPAGSHGAAGNLEHHRARRPHHRRVALRPVPQALPRLSPAADDGEQR